MQISAHKREDTVRHCTWCRQPFVDCQGVFCASTQEELAFCCSYCMEKYFED
jgi:hypothetical protein